MQSEASEHEKRFNGNLNDEDAAKARTRVSRACTRCRTRKDKCNGERPACSACLSAGQTCNYEPATKKRGLPEGYVRGLEKLFALLMGKIDGFEDATSLILREQRNELCKIWNHTTVGEDLHTSWKESKIIHELEGLLSSLDQTNTTTGQKRKREREDEELAENETDLSFHTRQQYMLSGLGPGSKSNTLSISASSSRAIPPLPTNALQLVDHYFAHTHCWFPVLHKPHVTRACYELGRGKSQASNESTAPLLWAIFAYTSSQLKPVGQSRSSGDSPESNSEIQDFRLKSLSFMPEHTENLKTVHAQAFLILALLDIGLGSWRSAWDHVGRAVRIVLSDAAGNKLMVKATAGLNQGCAILDVVIASHLRCVPHMRRADVESLSPMSEDGHEEWEPWCAPNMAPDLQREPSFSISCFNRLTEIFLTVGDVLALQPHIDKIDKTYIQSLLAKLHQLQTTFPGQMPPNSQSPPHQIYLQLCHVSAQIRLVEVPVDSGAGPHERAKLACNVLSLLALCRNTSVIGLQHVPPFIVDGLEAALRLANSSKSSFGPLTGLPPFEDFYKTANGFLAGMSSTWPAYTNAYNNHRNSSQAPSLGSGPFTPSPMAQTSIITSTHRAPSLHAQRSSPITMQHTAVTSSHRHSRTHSGLPALSNNRLMSTENIGGFQYGTFNSDVSMLGEMTSTPSQLDINPAGGFQDDLDTSNLSGAIDFDMNSNEFSGPVGIAMPETSPSFQGDEIDAIFHEMAHLDTNEWNNERAIGLKDFGFTDDLTFQAFCNDPDRLLAPSLGPQQTLSSESQTWMFAGADLTRS